ncbi:hypothetical protein FHY55_18575 [Oceanicola sp. D3]|uniref:hypothetical protein n=1 Tax=Oceanicola sp. D3 TaxID=2587163 RepID=UPI00111D867F|nr:hypothetical protein [Oceanicola sp. D3]QDC11115.1 hypothetical protein FHY55_18575 [Oceanicola sp. D3]
MTRFPALLTAFALAAAAPLAAQTTDASPEPTLTAQGAELAGFTLQLGSTEDVVSGETFKADADYLTKHGKPEAAPFAVVVPLSGDGSYESRVVETPRTGLVKFVFSTPGGGLIEAMTFSELTLPEAEKEPRLDYLREIMLAVAVGQFVDSKPEASRQNIRKVDIGRHKAVEIFGTYRHADYGVIHWRMVGLPNPDGEAGVVALAQISEEAVPIGSPDDFPASLTGRMLESFSFD